MKISREGNKLIWKIYRKGIIALIIARAVLVAQKRLEISIKAS
jgi:hypothetical protein